MKIRPARIDDAIRLTEIALRSKAHWGYPAEFMQRAREELTVEEQDIDAPLNSFYVAETNEGVAGFCAIIDLLHGQFELDRLYVEPDWIGAGVGRMLFSHATSVAGSLGGRQMTIQGDPNARDFYLAMGAREVGERESDSIPGRLLPLFVYTIGE